MHEARESAWHELGTWKQIKTCWGLSAQFTCPDCGLTRFLDLREFHIAPDGIVEPSIDCPGDKDSMDCPFHDRIKLIDWEPGKLHDYRPREEGRRDEPPC